MINFKRAAVTAIRRERPGYVEAVVEVDGKDQLAVCYPALIGEVKPGDEVVINTTAVDLALGTGGRHFILWNLATQSVTSREPGHIMKLRYTPMQLKRLAVEESDSPHHETLKDVTSIDDMPVVVGTLHSQLPAAVAVMKERKPEVRIAYVMTDGAALPIAFSELVARLKGDGLIDTTITVGHAFGGDIEAVNVFSGLAAARHVASADVAVVCMGPGIVGSGTRLGFSGIEQGQIVNAVNGLKGQAIAIPRISFADTRKRHYGVSHHTVTALTIAATTPATVAVPQVEDEKARVIDEQILTSGIAERHSVIKVDASVTLDALRKRGFSPTTMGRTLDEEQEFFMAAGAAGMYAIDIVSGGC